MGVVPWLCVAVYESTYEQIKYNITQREKAKGNAHLESIFWSMGFVFSAGFDSYIWLPITLVGIVQFNY